MTLIAECCDVECHLFCVSKKFGTLCAVMPSVIMLTVVAP
jgi:hypothetical protein